MMARHTDVMESAKHNLRRDQDMAMRRIRILPAFIVGWVLAVGAYAQSGDSAMAQRLDSIRQKYGVPGACSHHSARARACRIGIHRCPTLVSFDLPDQRFSDSSWY